MPTVAYHRSEESYSLAKKYMNPKLVDVMDILGFNKIYTHAKGNYLYEKSGDAYLDFHSGEGFASLGHAHPALKKALIQAIEDELPDGTQIHYSAHSGLLAEKLHSHLPESLDAFFFTNSGTETVEVALKFARACTKRKKLLSCHQGYHGLTYGALSVTSEKYFQDGFGPLVPDCEKIPFNDIEALENALRKKDVAAFIVEPIQGRAVAVPDPAYFPAVRELCNRYGTLLIFDEIQTGLGRTGKWFALEHWNIEPDFVLCAKALSGGFIPVGVMATRREIYNKVVNTLDRCYVQHSTYGRNRLAMIAGLATLQTIEQDDLVEHVQNMGIRLLAGLESLRKKHPLIKDVRGMGLMVGFELGCPDSLKGKIEWNLIQTASKGLYPQLIVIPLHRDHRIITMASGHNDVIKLLPPYTVTEKEIDYFLNALDAVLTASAEGTSSNWKIVYDIAKRTLMTNFASAATPH